jgi:hypothetical protein
MHSQHFQNLNGLDIKKNLFKNIMVRYSYIWIVHIRACGGCV